MNRLLLFALAFFPAITLADPVSGPERWEGDMKKFSARDKATPPEPDALLFVGSSSIRMWDLEKSWPDTNVVNNGFGGSTLADSIYHFDTLFGPQDPKAIIIYAGDNDIAKSLTPKETLEDFKTLADKIRAKFPEVPVIYIAIKPSIKRWELWPTMKEANDLIETYSNSRPDFYFADIATPMLKEAADSPPSEDWFVQDGLHLSEKGYRRWTNVVNRHLKSAGVVD